MGRGASVLLILLALLACKSKSNVTGKVTLDGRSFTATDCQLSEFTLAGAGSSTTTHTVTLIDASKRRLSFSDSGGMRVSFSPGGTVPSDEVGEGCGRMSMSGSVKSPGSAKGHVEASCTGGGHKVEAKFDFASCGQYGL